MTEDQETDDQRLARYLERENLASLMNDTKWREVIDAIQGIERYVPRFRVKCVKDAQEPARDRWDGSFPLHVPTFRHIEWLEFDPMVRTRIPPEDFTERLELALAAIGVPVERVGGAIRLIGYWRPAKP